MRTTRTVRHLPCPYCGEPVPMRLSDFFPSRRWPNSCPSCSRAVRIPMGVCLASLLLLLPYFVAVGMFLSGDFYRAESVLGFVVVHILVLGSSAPFYYILCRLSFRFTDHLE
jgi:endogenous inhibitor of DNA gyrase (YacG/DUF329 family)